MNKELRTKIEEILQDLHSECYHEYGYDEDKNNSCIFPEGEVRLLALFTSEMKKKGLEVIGEDEYHEPREKNAAHPLGCRKCMKNKLRAEQRKRLDALIKRLEKK